MIIQFFGKRKEGSSERAEWRSLVEEMPRLEASSRHDGATQPGGGLGRHA